MSKALRVSLNNSTVVAGKPIVTPVVDPTAQGIATPIVLSTRLSSQLLGVGPK